MSRIGRMPITVPAGVTVKVAEGNVVTVKGPKGELTRTFSELISIKEEGEELLVVRNDDTTDSNAHECSCRPGSPCRTGSPRLSRR